MRELFGEHVDRAPLRGVNDHGDFSNTPWLVEAKNHLRPSFMEWARTAEIKTGVQSEERFWVVWKGDRRKGKGQGPYVLMPLAQAAELVRGQVF